MDLNAAPLGGLHGRDVVGLEDLGELGQPLEVAKSNARAAGVLSRYGPLSDPVQAASEMRPLPPDYLVSSKTPLNRMSRDEEPA